LFKNKVVLITGGTGTVGRALTVELLGRGPRAVRIFSRDESKQYEMQKEFRGEKRLRFFIGDVRDKDRLLHAMDNVDFIFHAAAMKHVIACEYNPFEALYTNIEGSKNLIEAALESGAKKVILTSTDKATNPCNTMGVSKLFAERLFTAANYYKGKSRTVFSAVRFGNILGSRGSVLTVFRKQMENGEPLTITDPEMTRFVMTRSEAIDFVFRATSLAKGGEIFIAKMPVVKMKDMANAMLDLYSPESSGSKLDVDIIGSQPGEKLFEELMTDEEVTRAVETKDMFILKPQVTDLFEQVYEYPGERTPKIARYTSEHEKCMTVPQIKKLLKKIDRED